MVPCNLGMLTHISAIAVSNLHGGMKLGLLLWLPFGLFLKLPLVPPMRIPKNSNLNLKISHQNPA